MPEDEIRSYQLVARIRGSLEERLRAEAERQNRTLADIVDQVLDKGLPPLTPGLMHDKPAATKPPPPPPSHQNGSSTKYPPPKKKP